MPRLRANKVEKLDDDKPDSVSGGWPNILPCHKRCDYTWCEMASCPHRKRGARFFDQEETYCDLGCWKKELQLPDLSNMNGDPPDGDS